MQVEIRCVYVLKGFGKESKAAYSLFRCKIPLKAQSFKAGTTERQAFGVEDQEVEIPEAAFPIFSGLKLPGVYDVETDQIQSQGKLVTIFTGVRSIQKQA